MAEGTELECGGSQRLNLFSNQQVLFFFPLPFSHYVYLWGWWIFFSGCTSPISLFLLLCIWKETIKSSRLSNSSFIENFLDVFFTLYFLIYLFWYRRLKVDLQNTRFSSFYTNHFTVPCGVKYDITENLLKTRLVHRQLEHRCYPDSKTAIVIIHAFKITM